MNSISTPNIMPSFQFELWYLLLDYRVWALVILGICILIKFKKPEKQKFATLIIVQDIIVTSWMMLNGSFEYITGSSLLDDNNTYYSLGDAIWGCGFLIIGIFILSLFYLGVEKIVNYKRNEK